MQKRPPVKQGYFCVGVITAAHGIKGEVTVKLFTSSPESIHEYGTLFDENDVPFHIQNVKFSKKGALVAFENVRSRNEAERLMKTYLYVSDEFLPQLDENDMFLDDLVGTSVYFENGDKVGVIRSHFDNGAHTVVQIKRTEAGVKDILIPYTDGFILEADVEAKKIVVSDMVEDFFDL